jgi:hypothetical protein
LLCHTYIPSLNARSPGGSEVKENEKGSTFLLYMFFYCKRYHPGILARLGQLDSSIIR